MKSNTLKSLILVFGIALFMSSSAFAQSKDRPERKEPPTYAQLLKEMDANEDGKLAKDELKGPLKDDFTKIDTDEDGFISEEEFKNAPKPERKERSRNK
ncbi:EF-hand domain-containing protein [Winogradskyella sp. Asnod2-B02-A]|uniref:EF-hand domain-containing protein n=1 Tax=Winogradskyella sp. Asnod2-B02-A TaxID=3160583 RepID=UPI00386346C3